MICAWGGRGLDKWIGCELLMADFHRVVHCGRYLRIGIASGPLCAGVVDGRNFRVPWLLTSPINSSKSPIGFMIVLWQSDRCDAICFSNIFFVYFDNYEQRFRYT